MTLQPHATRFATVLAMAVALVGGTGVARAADEEKSFDIYGFAMLDFIQDFDRVNPDWEDTLRPSRIPTDDGQFGGDGQTSVSAKQSRFGVKANLPTEKGQSRQSSSSTCSVLVKTRARRRSACATPMVSSASSSRARRTPCSWTATSSRT